MSRMWDVPSVACGAAAAAAAAAAALRLRRGVSSEGGAGGRARAGGGPRGWGVGVRPTCGSALASSKGLGEPPNAPGAHAALNALDASSGSMPAMRCLIRKISVDSGVFIPGGNSGERSSARVGVGHQPGDVGESARRIERWRGGEGGLV